MSSKREEEYLNPGTNIWYRVKRDIELKIITGEYATGERIPTIVKLMEQYQIGKATAQKVINSLYDEGVIIKKVGMGCFVKPFVKEMLLAKHKNQLAGQIMSAVEEASLMGLDKNYVVKIMDETWGQANK